MDDAAFDAVVANSTEEYACSPSVPENAIGLFLAAPIRLVVPADRRTTPRLVVCLSIGFSILQHRRTFGAGRGNPVNAAAFILTVPVAGLATGGPMIDGKERIDDDEPNQADPSDQLSDEEAAAHTFVDHANPDLGYLLHGLTTPGTCFVHAVLGPLISNTVGIALVRA